MSKNKPTNKQLIFANEYVISGCDVAEAAKRAGYEVTDEKDYAVVGQNVLKADGVQTLIKDISTRLEKRYELTTDKIAREMAQLAFFDIADILYPNGTLKPLNEIPVDARRAIVSIEVEQNFDKDGKPKGKLKKVKLASKEKNLEMLARIKGMFNDNVNVTGKISHEHKVSVSTIDLDERIAALSGGAIETTAREVTDADIEEALS